MVHDECSAEEQDEYYETDSLGNWNFQFPYPLSSTISNVRVTFILLTIKKNFFQKYITNMTVDLNIFKVNSNLC